MNDDGILNTEEDLKIKVISEWLRGHGFRAPDISLEKTFELRFGRSTLVIGAPETACRHARCDYLVRAHDGRNLMIIEAKAPGERLDDQVKEQGISYARALRHGGIAPFTVLTNGKDTLIYDSGTEQLLNGTLIPLDNQHVLNGFRYCGDDIALRAEALRVLVSLSPENLLAFCRNSVNDHLRLLRSTDLKSGKKYIPQLYVERPTATTRLNEALAKPDRAVTLVLGPPQVGKTNLLCHFTEAILSRGEPCLFYPAISIRKGLTEQLADDFQWSFGGEQSLPAIAQKLNAVLARTHQQLLIVVDGWNEAESEIACALNDECRRLATCDVRFVLSMTNIAARRLLVDKANNTGFVADTVGLSREMISLVELAPEKLRAGAGSCDQLNVVGVERYSAEEVDQAYKTYSRHYSVQIPEGAFRSADPFLIGIAMPLFANDTLPLSLDEPSIIELHLDRKAEQVGTIDPVSVRALLRVLGEEVFQNGAPVSENALLARCGLAISASFDVRLFEAALLIRREDRGVRTIDFYYDRERAFVIAEWVRKWPVTMGSSFEALRQEIVLAMATGAGAEALLWFFGQLKYIRYLKDACERLDTFGDDRVRKALLSAILKVLSTSGRNDEWMRECMERCLGDASNLVRLEAVKLMTLLADEAESIVEHLSADSVLIADLLTIDDEYPLSKGAAGQIVLDALSELHHRTSEDGGDSSPVSAILSRLVHSEQPSLRRAASRALGSISPQVFFDTVSLWIGQGVSRTTGDAVFAGVEQAIHTLGEYYYGSYCPGYLEALKQDGALENEYERMIQLLAPTIRFFGRGKCQGLVDILGDLCPAGVAEVIETMGSTYNPNQLDMAF